MDRRTLLKRIGQVVSGASVLPSVASQTSKDKEMAEFFVYNGTDGIQSWVENRKEPIGDEEEIVGTLAADLNRTLDCQVRQAIERSSTGKVRQEIVDG